MTMRADETFRELCERMVRYAQECNPEDDIKEFSPQFKNSTPIPVEDMNKRMLGYKLNTGDWKCKARDGYNDTRENIQDCHSYRDDKYDRAGCDADHRCQSESLFEEFGIGDTLTMKPGIYLWS